MIEKTKPLIVSCSVLKAEIQKLIKQGDLDADAVFVSKYFHVDYSLIERNLRRTLQENLSRAANGTVLVYGDLCLGPNNEMKQLAAEYGVVKVDALNCTDCLLGGKGKIAEVDPNHELLILHPGLIGFFGRLSETAKKENIDEEALKNLFSGIKGIVLLDTLGEPDLNREEIQKLATGLPILETKAVGLGNLKRVLLEALDKTANNLQEKRRRLFPKG